jgi:thiol-disulfide isomerase/thioredoxin
MPDTHEPAPTVLDEPPAANTPDDAPVPTPRRRLPIGPFALFVMTAVALIGAFVVTKLVVDAASDSDAMDLQEALNGVGAAPLVADESLRAELDGPAPNVRLEFLDGGEGQLAEVAGLGTPVVLNFWSSTCAPCLNEMPAIESVSQQLGDRVTVLGIDSQDTVESGQKMVEQTGVTYRNARDPRGEIGTVFGALALPRTVLIDGDGTIVAMHSGELDEAGFVQLLGDHGFPTP